MERLSRQILFETLPDAHRRKPLPKKVLGTKCHSGPPLSNATNGAAHSDLADWLLMKQNVVKQNITIRMTKARSYDRLNRLMGISSIPAGASQLPLSFQYSYNDANQRIRVGLHDGSYWLYIQAVAGVNSASSTGSVFLAKTPETFVHDADGNLIQDGRWTYTWDGENRLVTMEALSAVPAAAKLRVEFEYDWRGRRIGKTVKAWSGSTYTNVYILKFLYDGWNLVAELDANRAVVRSYLWGTDMSGSFQGAGGVGGLLAVNVATNGVHFPAYDGNGNIAGLVSASAGTTTARFEYGPFAEPIRVSGLMAKAMPLRFSTKYLDDEAGLYYYGYRYYDPTTGRWVSRDPIGERGGKNLYSFAINNPKNVIDKHGLYNPITGPDGIPVGPGSGLPDPTIFLPPNLQPPPPTPPDPTGFALCIRDVNPEGLAEHVLLIGFRILHPQTPTDHAYLHYKHCDKCERVGWGIGGTKPGAPPKNETVFNPTDCKPCKKTESLLQYGAPGKKGTDATDSEILDCISEVPTSKNYRPTGKGHYNCMDWAKEAASKCGLDCN